MLIFSSCLLLNCALNTRIFFYFIYGFIRTSVIHNFIVRLMDFFIRLSRIKNESLFWMVLFKRVVYMLIEYLFEPYFIINRISTIHVLSPNVEFEKNGRKKLWKSRINLIKLKWNGKYRYDLVVTMWHLCLKSCRNLSFKLLMIWTYTLEKNIYVNKVCAIFIIKHIHFGLILRLKCA